ncbi:TAFII55 protein conserved region-domain-containing protein [Hypoxylon rubiginosum]|uniref:TAFII55 protein conserved region-domain-containing protein n=1 Tax=Hypoxylon rubiginosum TaxID=110542 RepID=A0ACB9YM14_9PEZI|nr:TAFII55 protein conserved region-domain-containing protein [Hypoxylon rubiginosum]
MSSINVKPTLKLDTAQNMPPPSNPDNPRPILKVNTNSRQSSFSGDVGTPTPSGEIRKIKIKLNSQPSTPAATPANQTPSVTKSKAGRMSKPTAKLIEARKRPHDSDDEDQPLSLSRHDSNRPDKRIKVTSKSTPTSVLLNTPISSIKFKPRGEPVEHHPGDAYDSEASDREADPARETTFVLRALPGSPAEYLKKALAEGTMGQSKQNGGADFGVQFLDGKQRRAMITINGKNYAAVLVHLPTITEAMKSWDRKNMMKNSDVTEMLLCFAEVRNENEAKSVPLPPMVVKYEHKWPHGITPPMHDAVHRRFRKTLSEKQWQTSAEIVSKLLEEDAAAMETHVDFLQDEDGDMYSDDEEDAEGEIEQDYFGDQAGEPMEEDDEDDEMIAAMEAELAGVVQEEEEEEEPAVTTPAVKLEAPTPMAEEMNTPAGVAEEIISEEDEDDDDEDEDEDDEDEEMDDEQLAAERERKEKADELELLKRQYEDTKRQLTEVTAPILKKRLLSTKASLEKEIAVKRAALGLVDED